MDQLEIIGWVLASFGLLNAISKFFTFIADKTSSTLDNKIAAILSKGLTYASKIIDTFTAKK